MRVEEFRRQGQRTGGAGTGSGRALRLFFGAGAVGDVAARESVISSSSEGSSIFSSSSDGYNSMRRFFGGGVSRSGSVSSGSEDCESGEGVRVFFRDFFFFDGACNCRISSSSFLSARFLQRAARSREDLALRRACSSAASLFSSSRLCLSSSVIAFRPRFFPLLFAGIVVIRRETEVRI